MSDPVRMALVDDSAEFRAEMAALFRRHPGFELVALCSDGQEAAKTLPAARPDVVLVDLNLPDRNGIEVVRELHALLPAARLLMLTIEHDGRRLIEALAAGAVGYLVKTTPADRLLEAVRDTVDGGSPISSNVARLLVERFQPASRAEPESAALTDREREILDLFAKGHRAKEVAATIDLSIHTVRAAVRIIYNKLQAHSLAEAVAKYRK